MKAKYSILIPTRNGADYLPYAIQSVLTQDYPNCEVIVSVNHSSDNSLEVLKQFNDPRLNVLIPPQPLSMTKNFEWLLQQATGEWVTYLGDDDGLMPYFFDEVDQILLRWPHVESILSKGAYYNWEKAKAAYSIERIEKQISSKLWLWLMLAGIKKYTDLPSLYTAGVTHRPLIKRILDKSSAQFYHDLAPDVYSGVAIAANLSHFVQIGTPLFWRGTSQKSTGMSHILSAYGTADKAMKKRADEFYKMSQKDGIQLQKDINVNLWLFGISPFLIYTSLRQLPFNTNLFKGKWVQYLVYPSIFQRIRQLEREGETDQAYALQTAYQQQLKQNHIRNGYVKWMAFFLFDILFPLKFVFRWYRSLKKRLKKTNKERLKVEKIADLDQASKEVMPIYQKVKHLVVRF